MKGWRGLALAPAALVAPHVAFSAVYLSVEQAQHILYPGIALAPVDVRLTDEQRRLVEQRTGGRARTGDLRVWRAADGAMFVVDDVVGKHEKIAYAIGIGADGAIRGIEILEYRESYGYEVRNASWRAQFRGKTAAAPLDLERDIRNISGATLSCKHLTEGIRRLLVIHDVAWR
ncbi:MAG: FMN-binding protein [Betaproteobacteria bacterium]|jgi:hypothetical protein